MLYLGIDISTQGARGLVADEKGNILVSHSVLFRYLNITGPLSSMTGPLFEQSPNDWWNCVKEVISSCTYQLRERNIPPEDIVALALDGTSGTILLADKNNNPIRNAILYNDSRSSVQADFLNDNFPEIYEKLGYKFNFSFALPKIMWLYENTHYFENAKKILHQADYVLGKLCGVFGVTDYSNALKTGYDILNKQYAPFIDKLGFPTEMLPRVESPGTIVGRILSNVALDLGLSNKTIVCLGSTDSYASALSSGAVDVNEYATILGSTMVIKGVSKDLIKDPQGRMYCHLHPQGYFMPGGASNVGGKYVSGNFVKTDLPELDKYVLKNIPTRARIYPLPGRGERFPFVNVNAVGFKLNLPSSEPALLAATMEGMAYTERLCYDTLASLGAVIGDTIYSTGGATRVDEWLDIRTSILNKSIKVPKSTSAALGSAIIAASNCEFENITSAVRQMVQISKVVEPNRKYIRKYDKIYKKFLKDVAEHYDYSIT